MATVAMYGLVACGTAPAADAPEYRGPDHVLAIGVGRYEWLTDIPGAANDPKLFDGIWPYAKTIRIVNEKATAAGIKDAFDRLKTDVKKGGFSVIFLAGHGGRDAGAWSFCPHDYDPARPKQTQIHGGWIAGRVGELVERGDRVLLIVDSCHSGELRTHLEHLLGAEAGKGGVILLASSVPSQVSKERDGNGLFATVVAGGLRGLADTDADGNVTLKELRRYTGWRLRERLREKAQLPGLEWPEQDAVCDSSATVNDLQPLSAAREKKAKRNLEGLRLDANDRIGKTGGLFLPDLDGWADKLAKPVAADRLGAWHAIRSYEEPAVRITADGQKQDVKVGCRNTVTLRLDDDGEYTIEYRHERQSVVAGGKPWVGVRAVGKGAFRYLEVDGKKYLVLDYGNGASGLTVGAWDAKEFRLKPAESNTFALDWPNETWIFGRGK